jgi:hypothetical protein
MMFFGKRYDAPAYIDCPQAETPVGRRCVYCEEQVVIGDDGWIYNDGSVHHRECHFRAIVGSVAHQQRRCSCYGGTGSDHDDGMTRREGAKAAVEYAERPRRRTN